MKLRSLILRAFCGGLFVPVLLAIVAVLVFACSKEQPGTVKDAAFTTTAPGGASDGPVGDMVDFTK